MSSYMVDEMLEAVAQCIAESHTDRFDDMALVRNDARAATESLGIPLEVLAAVKAGTWQAVPKESTLDMRVAMRDEIDMPTGSGELSRAYSAALASAPKTPSEV